MKGRIVVCENRGIVGRRCYTVIRLPFREQTLLYIFVAVDGVFHIEPKMGAQKDRSRPFVFGQRSVYAGTEQAAKRPHKVLKCKFNYISAFHIYISFMKLIPGKGFIQ